MTELALLWMTIIAVVYKEEVLWGLSVWVAPVFSCQHWLAPSTAKLNASEVCLNCSTEH